MLSGRGRLFADALPPGAERQWWQRVRPVAHETTGQVWAEMKKDAYARWRGMLGDLYGADPADDVSERQHDLRLRMQDADWMNPPKDAPARKTVTDDYWYGYGD
jgi:hypothetical protein